MNIVQMTISASVLIVAIVIVRSIMLHKVPKKTFIVLWAVTVARLLVPFSIPSKFSIFSLFSSLSKNPTHLSSDMVEMISNIITPSFNGIGELTTDMTISTVSNSPISIFLVIWMAGVIFLSFFFITTHLHCVSEYKTSLPVHNEFIDTWLKLHITKRPIKVRQSDKIITPLTYGIFKPIILLPKSIDFKDEVQLEHIMSHEYVHIKRFDILFKMILAVTLCVHWFNPFVWIMYFLANRDIELSCDENVVKMIGEDRRSEYAMALISLEERKLSLSPLYSTFSRNTTKERIESVMKYKKISLIALVISLLTIMSVTTVFATSTVKYNSDTWEYTDSTLWVYNSDQCLFYYGDKPFKFTAELLPKYIENDDRPAYVDAMPSVRITIHDDGNDYKFRIFYTSDDWGDIKYRYISGATYEKSSIAASLMDFVVLSFNPRLLN